MVFPYDTHVAYFRDCIAPRLNDRIQFVGAVGGDVKCSLLSSASCVIVASTVAETSSLVAMEALASGTPVVAFKTPALEELIEDGRTGFLVRDVTELAHALARVADINGDTCRLAAESQCSLSRMTDEYLALYDRIAEAGRSRHDGVTKRSVVSVAEARA
jgi:glycosyltransferase involved in cell wall biosynthesis